MNHDILQVFKYFEGGQMLAFESDIVKDGLDVLDKRTTQDDTGVHHVKPVATDGETFYVVCPHCKRIHAHKEIKKVNRGKCKKGAYIIERMEER